MDDLTKYFTSITRIIDLAVEITNLDEMAKADLKQNIIEKYFARTNQLLFDQLSAEDKKTVDLVLQVNDKPEDTLLKINLLYAEKLSSDKVLDVALSGLESIMKEAVKIIHSQGHNQLTVAFDKEIKATMSEYILPLQNNSPVNQQSATN